ncbi:CAP domain-containing protein [Candidatus Binatus sp.]|uniref:CAP domain-containing protein n=1 Tax=Candidatus Binatus sp. TaxID=2811406 RepID=UPI002F9342B5
MRYFTSEILLVVATIFMAIRAGAQVPANPASPGVPPDFASSANARVNYYRAMAKLPPVVNDSAISAGAYNHARYLVKNGIAGGDIVLDGQRLRIQSPQDAFRWEVKGKPFYTDEGASAGRDAVVIAARKIDLSGADFVDRMMTMPFSGLVPMVPQFSVVGLGAYCDPGQCAIVIPGRFALEKSVRLALYDGPASDRLWNPSLGLIPIETGRLRSPVEFPPDGATVNLQSYAGGDYPDPLSSCPGYKAPTGTPISIQLGKGYGPDGSLEVSSDLVWRDGVEIETCLITAASYAGRNAEQTEAVKAGLARGGAAVMIPREPLAPGHYKVALKEAGKLYEWGFTVAAPARPAQSAPR